MSDNNIYVGVDFETYYDDAYSLKSMIPALYIHDDRFKAYMVSVYSPELGLRYAGPPEKFDWSLLEGRTLCAHNATFDGWVLKRIQELGLVPSVKVQWLCTADMAAYLRAPRNLSGACKALLGREVSKVTREKLRGLTLEQAVASGLHEELLEYVMADSVNSYDLMKSFGAKWPEAERELSRLNRESQWSGIPCDREKAEADVRHLEGQMMDMEDRIPWKDTDKLLSPKAFRAECRKHGVSAPASLSKKNTETMRWFDEHSEKFPFAAAMRDYRSANGILNRARSMRDAIMDDGFMRFTMLYVGAINTGRFSSGFHDDDDSASKVKGRFNLTNMPRKPLFGVDLRRTIAAPSGYKLIVADYGQIEARLILWRAGETSFLGMLAEEGNLYQAYAKYRGIYSGNNLKEEDNSLYNYMKVNVLSCGFGCGWKKYRDMALTDYGFDFAPEVAKDHVDTYRRTFPKVPKYWRNHNDWLRISVNHKDPTHVVPLVSGRKLTYFQPHWQSRLRTDDDGEHQESYEIVASTVMGDTAYKLYGGKLAENEIQATARDVLRDAWIKCDKVLDPEVCRTLFSVYDELIFLCRDAYVATALEQIPELMTTSAPYLTGCPMGVDIKAVERYCK